MFDGLNWCEQIGLVGGLWLESMPWRRRIKTKSLAMSPRSVDLDRIDLHFDLLPTGPRWIREGVRDRSVARLEKGIVPRVRTPAAARSMNSSRLDSLRFSAGWRLSRGVATIENVMVEEAIRKAEVLTEALGYIRKFRQKTVVIKLGGSVLEYEEMLDSTLQDVLFLETVGLHPIIVHGGGKAISRAMHESGIEPRFVQGRRYTDPEP